MKFLHLLLLVSLLLLIPFVSASTAQIGWVNTTYDAICVTAVDTNVDGTMIMVGLGNGTIFVYQMNINTSDNTADAVQLLAYSTNSSGSVPKKSIKKIVADSAGNFAWISEANETGYISSTQAIASHIHGTNTNITDVEIRGNTYAISELNPPRIRIFNTDGTIYAQNATFGAATKWVNIGYDPNNEWLVSANETSNRVYFWNVSTWNGWVQFNPNKTAVKNVSQQFVDEFPYRLNITVNSNTEKGIWFFNATNTTYFTKVADNYYFANFATTGRYFHWTIPNNLSNASNWSERPQNALLNMSSGDSTTYLVTIRPGYSVYNIYFGNTTYSNQFVNQSWTNNGTLFRQNLTGGSTWATPAYVQAVNLTLIGGGGGGHDGFYTYYYEYSGYGGYSSTGSMTSYSNVIVVPGVSNTIGIGGGGARNAGGGATTFNNGTYTATANGAAAPNSGTRSDNPAQSGAAGNTSIPGYPTASDGGDIWSDGWNCLTGSWQYGGNGGIGFGAGGGGGAGKTSCGGMTVGAGGPGAAGVIQISYYINDIPVYYYGVSPSSSTFDVLQNRQTGYSMNNTHSNDYVGDVMHIAVPSNGGLAAISTNSTFYMQGILAGTGFSWYACGTTTTGPAVYNGASHDVKVSNSGSIAAEGRGAYGIVYTVGGLATGVQLTGNEIRSVDVAMSSGLFAAWGGDEGKIYMMSKAGSNQWYSYYTGTETSGIDAVAVSWNGESVLIGEENGKIVYYLTNVTIPVVPTPSYVDANIRVYKDSTSYPNQPVTVYSSTATPYVWSPAGTTYTDGGGRCTFTTLTGTYYKFVVNNVPGTTSGEGEATWQSNSASSLVQIFIVSASTPYEWNAYYTTPANNVTVVYSDKITPTSVTVTIKDLKTNLDVLTRTYTSTPSFTLEYHDQLGNGTYQVNILINRMGISVRDQRMVSSPLAYGTILPNDKYITWAISTFFLMLLAGMFSYSNSKRGALAVVVVAVILMIAGLLPWDMLTVAMLAAIFAVMSLFGSRVQ